jgi:hypothetical protein
VKQRLAVINQMQAEGVIGKYAIGGAVGATRAFGYARCADIRFVPLRPCQFKWARFERKYLEGRK